MGWRDSARQSSWRCQYRSVPPPLQGSWPRCPSRPPTVQLHMCLGAVLLPGVSQPPAAVLAPLCPPMGLPLGLPPVPEPGLCASESASEWGSKFGTRDSRGRKQALLFSSILYQDGPTPISAGFLRSANEHYVSCYGANLCWFVGPGKELDDSSPAQQQARLFPEPALVLWRISIHRSMMWLQCQSPALPTKVVSSWFPAGSAYICTHPCTLWLAQNPRSEWPGFWEMEINSTLPSLEIQAAVVVSLLSWGPGPRLPLALPQGDALCLPQPRARSSRLGGPARSLSPAEHSASAQLPPWCSRGCVTARSLLPYYHTAVASYCSPA